MTDKKDAAADGGTPSREDKRSALSSSRTANGSTGAKGRIASRVAHDLFPDGNGIDLNQDISNSCGSNAGVLTSDINARGEKYSEGKKLVFTPVGIDDVQSLRTVRDLKDLIISRLG